MMRGGLVLLIVLLCGDALAAGVELGRLIYSPEERTRLEAQRHAAELADPVESSSIVADTVRLRGVVTRTDGRAFLWLDGKRVQPKRSAHMNEAASRLRAHVGREVAVRSAVPSSPPVTGSPQEGARPR